jgi:dinuclear metal center YbgI/SA1388 family protein
MNIKTITQALERFAPISLQENYDNCGLIVGDEQTELTKVLVSLDITEKVVQEAIDKGCNLIVAHHPIVFFGLKKINNNNYVEKAIIKAIKNDIAIYAIHTNLDKVSFGVNKMIADKIGLINTNILKKEEMPKMCMGSPRGVVGMGMIGELENEEFVVDFLFRIKKIFGCEVIKHTATNNKPIKKIAVCGGSGFSLLKDSINNQADVLITADVTYHQFFDANDKIVLADIGHYESEQFTKELIKNIIDEFMIETESITMISEINTNPVNYI